MCQRKNRLSFHFTSPPFRLRTAKLLLDHVDEDYRYTVPSPGGDIASAARWNGQPWHCARPLPILVSIAPVFKRSSVASTITGASTQTIPTLFRFHFSVKQTAPVLWIDLCLPAHFRWTLSSRPCPSIFRVGFSPSRYYLLTLDIKGERKKGRKLFW